MNHGYIHIYTQHSMIKYLLKLIPECLTNDTCRCKRLIEAACHQENDKHNSTTIHQEGKAGACITLKHTNNQP